MGSFSIWHWALVILVVVLLFGRGKISDLMGDVAKGIKSFKKGMADDEDAPFFGELFTLPRSAAYPTTLTLACEGRSRKAEPVTHEVELDSHAAARRVGMLLAEALGVSFATPEGIAAKETSADVVVHASGAPAGLALALQVAGLEARVVEASWYGTQAVPLALGEEFHAKRLTLVSSQVGHVAPAQRACCG